MRYDSELKVTDAFMDDIEPSVFHPDSMGRRSHDEPRSTLVFDKDIFDELIDDADAVVEEENGGGLSETRGESGEGWENGGAFEGRPEVGYRGVGKSVDGRSGLRMKSFDRVDGSCQRRGGGRGWIGDPKGGGWTRRRGGPKWGGRARRSQRSIQEGLSGCVVFEDDG